MLKVDLDVIAKSLNPLLSRSYMEKEIPQQWTDGFISKEIWSILCLTKSIIIEQKVTSGLEAVLKKEQTGFRYGWSSIAAIKTVRIIISSCSKEIVLYTGQAGLKINVAKTELLRFDLHSKQQPTLLRVNNALIEEVEKFCNSALIQKISGWHRCHTGLKNLFKYLVFY